MGIGSSFKKALGSLPGADKGAWGSFAESGEDSLNRKKADGTPYTAQEITTANLFRNLSTEQQKDLLLNNPNINTPGGSQNYDPLTNTISLTESDFQKAQRLRQENLAAQLTGSLDGNLSSDNKQIQDATFNRGKALIDPQLQQQRRQLIQQLADEGVPAGSEQYNERLNRFDDSSNRAYTDLSQASIQTSEAVRQQRFNEISSLLGTAQIGGENFQNYQPQFSGLDLFGAEQAGIKRAFESSQLSKQLKQQNKNAQYAALGSLGSAAIGGAAMASDINLKENIEKVGEENGFNIYEFNYKDNPEKRFRGVMAQEIQKIRPDAVVEHGGYLAVHYDKIDLEMTEVA
jgi:hypothetical protein